MPTYDYRCSGCGHEFEEFQSITAAPLKKCPACNKRTLQRLIGTGGGIIFKGSGFYETDYRSASYRRAAEAEKTPAASKSDTKSDSKETSTKPADKPAASSESKKTKGSSSGGGAGAGRRAAAV